MQRIEITKAEFDSLMFFKKSYWQAYITAVGSGLIIGYSTLSFVYNIDYYILFFIGYILCAIGLIWFMRT